MKKYLSLMLAIAMCTALVIPAYAVQSDRNEADSLPTLEDIQTHFPELQLGESGYIGDIALYADHVDLNEPVATYSAEDGEDLYYVNVYEDNSYLAYGWVEGQSISDGYLSKGIKASGKVYVYKFGAMFDLYYMVTYDAQTPSISNVSYPFCTWLVYYGVDEKGNPRPTEASATTIPSWSEK